MRTRKRITKFVVAAIAVATLGGVAPANAGCIYASAYVRQNGQNVAGIGKTCVVPAPGDDATESIGANPAVNGTGVIVEVWPAVP